MGFLDRFFGSNDPLAVARKAMEQKRWAEVLTRGTDLDRSRLEASQVQELDALLQQAGDFLGRLNLDEGHSCVRTGDLARAGEHFSLVRQHAHDPELLQQAEAGLNRLQATGEIPVAPPAAASSHCRSGGCQGSQGPQESVSSPLPGEFDREILLELVLGGYPDELKQRYLQLQGHLLEAVLLAHEQRELEAVQLFDQVAPQERDDLFHFERGTLLARMQRHAEACQDLRRTVEINPQHLPAQENLIDLLLYLEDFAAAEAVIEALLQSGQAPAFAHSRQCRLWLHRGEREKALAAGLLALQAGTADGDTLLLTANLLEAGGRLDEAEGVLQRLGGGGCSGGGNVHLAEFWLRHQRNLPQALESFKAAARSDGANPQWLFRIGQTYLRLGWHKEGAALLHKLLADESLQPELRLAVEAQLEGAA